MGTLIIHIGMHRCASTAIQSLLAAHRSVLAEAGGQLLLRADIKDNKRLSYLPRLRYHSALKPWCWGRLGRVAAKLDSGGGAGGDIVISAENLPGTMPGAGQYDFYPHIEGFFGGARRLADRLDKKLRLVMVARRQDCLIESQYAFRVSRGMTLSFSDFVSRLDTTAYSWDHIIRKAVKTGVADNLHVGVAEHISPAYVAHLLGLNLGGRLSGNQSLPPHHVNTVRALVLAGMDISDAAIRQRLFQALKQTPDLAAADIARVMGDSNQSPLALSALQGALNLAARMPLPLFDAAARQALLKEHAAGNARFLASPMVLAEADSWA